MLFVRFFFDRRVDGRCRYRADTLYRVKQNPKRVDIVACDFWCFFFFSHICFCLFTY